MFQTWVSGFLVSGAARALMVAVGAIIALRLVGEFIEFFQGEATGEGGAQRIARGRQYDMLDDHLSHLNNTVDSIAEEMDW
jgi:hypothetical protein